MPSVPEAGKFENLPMFMEHATPSEEAILDAAACAHGAVALDPHSETLRRALAVMRGLVQRTRAYRLFALPLARQRELLGRFLAALPSRIHAELERTVTMEFRRVHRRQGQSLTHFREVYALFGLRGATSYQARRLAAEGKIIEVRLGPRTLRYSPESVARYRERLVGG